MGPACGHSPQPCHPRLSLLRPRGEEQGAARASLSCASLLLLLASWRKMNQFIYLFVFCPGEVCWMLPLLFLEPSQLKPGFKGSALIPPRLPCQSLSILVLALPAACHHSRVSGSRAELCMSSSSRK